MGILTLNGTVITLGGKAINASTNWNCVNFHTISSVGTDGESFVVSKYGCLCYSYSRSAGECFSASFNYKICKPITSACKCTCFTVYCNNASVYTCCIGACAKAGACGNTAALNINADDCINICTYSSIVGDIEIFEAYSCVSIDVLTSCSGYYCKGTTCQCVCTSCGTA